MANKKVNDLVYVPNPEGREAGSERVRLLAVDSILHTFKNRPSDRLRDCFAHAS